MQARLSQFMQCDTCVTLRCGNGQVAARKVVRVTRFAAAQACRSRSLNIMPAHRVEALPRAQPLDSLG